MKINLECGNDIRNGYVNVTSWPLQELPDDLPDNTNIVVGNPLNLDPVFENDSAEEIVFSRLFNVIHPNHIIPALEHWHDKLAKDGLLKLSFVDIRLVSKFIHSGQL